MGAGSTPHLAKGIDTKKLLRTAISEDQRASYEADVGAYLEDLLADFNNRDPEKVNRHLKEIESALSSEIAGFVSLRFGGSVKRHTYVDGLSDIDTLAIIDNSELVDKSPAEVLQYFETRIKEHFPNTPVTAGSLAVTIEFSDGYKIQVLPALTTATGNRIASSDGTEWSNVIKPDKFAEKLTAVNQSNNGGVVPVIKLYKAINSKLPEDAKLQSYHIESIAVNAFENYDGPRDRKSMLLHLTEFASKAVLHPIKDSTGQSLRVDDKMGNSGSLERQRASVAIQRVAVRMKLADSEASVQRWKDLMEE